MKKITDFEKAAEVKLQAGAVVEAFKEELNALILKYSSYPGMNESKSVLVEGISNALIEASKK